MIVNLKDSHAELRFQLPTQEDKNNFKQFREVMHLLSHVQHILTDFNINFDDPVPRIASIPSGMRNHSITSDPGVSKINIYL